jgi:hypothetical protein
LLTIDRMWKNLSAWAAGRSLVDARGT